MGYHGPAPFATYVPIPEGDAGLLVTLQRIRANIRGHNPLADQLAAEFAAADPGTTETELADALFMFVQDHMNYMEEEFSPASDISDAIATPDAILAEIDENGKAFGDCAHYSTLLGALYLREGWPVTLVWVKTHNPEKIDGIEDHVFVTVETDEGTFTADGIIPEPFGWEIPAEEQLYRQELAV